MRPLTFQDVLNILRLIDSGTFSKMQIEYEGTKLNVTRHTGTGGGDDLEANRAVGCPAEPPVRPGAPAGGASPAADSQRASGSASDAAMPGVPLDYPRRVEVRPPMAGTFYAAPAPNAPPFVEVGGSVRKDDQLGVVEVMKLFTPVLSPCDGTVREILVGNEEFVESDQVLMALEAAE